jgi:Glutaredoxin-like domain (DUF836)
VLLGQPDCHLCHEMAAVVRPVLQGYGVGLVERDIRDDAEWYRLYRFEIPVLLLDGAELARHRVDADALRALLASRGR